MRQFLMATALVLLGYPVSAAHMLTEEDKALLREHPEVLEFLVKPCEECSQGKMNTPKERMVPETAPDADQSSPNDAKRP